MKTEINAKQANVLKYFLVSGRMKRMTSEGPFDVVLKISIANHRRAMALQGQPQILCCCY